MEGKGFQDGSPALGSLPLPSRHPYFAFYCCFLFGHTCFGALLDFPWVLTVFLLCQLLWDFAISSNLSITLANPFESPDLFSWVSCPQPLTFLFGSGYSLASTSTFILLFSLLWTSYKRMDVSSHLVYGFVCSTLMHSYPRRDQWEPSWHPLTDPFFV